MDCINCSAPLPAKTTRCPFCHTINDIDLRGRVTVKRGQTERDCPRCQQSLTAVMLGVGGEQVEIDRCLKCQGLFFDPGEVETILDGIEQKAESVDHRQLLTLIESETPTEDFETVSYVPCPDCQKLMNRRSFGQKSGVIIDSCHEHGLWLDGGELRRLIRATGRLVRRLHRHGCLHADLTPTNLLYEPSDDEEPRLWVIDLDRSVLSEDLSRADRLTNLRRLFRYVQRREARLGRCLQRSDYMRFLAGYEKDRVVRKETWRAIASAHRKRGLLHGLGWVFEAWFGRGQDPRDAA